MFRRNIRPPTNSYDQPVLPVYMDNAYCGRENNVKVQKCTSICCIRQGENVFKPKV